MSSADLVQRNGFGSALCVVDEGGDVGAQGSDAAIDAAPDLALGERAKKRST